MQELERLINIYHIAFIVFLVLTILFLAVSVFLFFWFNIRGIFDMKTGRGARRAIQKMQELNDQTGKLREETANVTASRLASGERIVMPAAEKRAHTPPPMGEAYSSKEIELLEDAGSRETQLLDPYHETTVLSASQKKNTQEPKKLNLPGLFKIEKEIMWIHTEEIL